MNGEKNNDHTFVVLAYGESEYLKDCIQSLKKQTVASDLVIATSTDNAYIRKIADEYDLPLMVNPNRTGIAGDFDFGLQAGKTKFVTIAHQDDTYEPDYLKEISQHLDNDTIIAFTDYYEQHPDGMQYKNRNLNIKRLMLMPLRKKFLQKSIWIRRRILAFGNPICCPSVTFCRDQVSEPIFESDFRSNMDWKAWELLSKKHGKFVYIPKPLMMHRIHDASTTTEVIRENRRTDEDYRMMCLFWPRWIARLLAKIYAGSEKNNQ